MVLGVNILYTGISFIIVLGILIFFHELGHFLLMKRLGVGVITFSFGFGPKLFGKKVGETEYQVCAIPFGGFVKPIGEDPKEDVKEEDRARSFSTQPKWKRLLIVVAGPMLNFFLAIAIFFFINPFHIVSPPATVVPATIGEVSPDLPAARAGLRKGDTVLSIDGKGISTWNDLSKTVNESQGKELVLKVKREGEVLEVRVTPIPLKDGREQKFRIGIIAPITSHKVAPRFEIGNGFKRTWDVTTFTVFMIVKVFQGEIAAKDAVGGPLAIAHMAGQEARKGPVDFLNFIALLSVSLGLFNLFPIPILDGGHVLFLVTEAVLRKPLSTRKMEIAQYVGLFLLILLMVYAFYNDLLRLLSPGKFNF